MTPRARTVLSLALGLALIGLVALASRLVRLGVVPPEHPALGAGTPADPRVTLTVEGEGGPHPLAEDARLGEEAEIGFRYGPTRLPYVWAVWIDERGVAPVLTERHTAPDGEALPDPLVLPADARHGVLMVLFLPVPTSLDEIRAAAAAVDSSDPAVVARKMYLPGWRMTRRIRRADPMD